MDTQTLKLIITDADRLSWAEIEANAVQLDDANFYLHPPPGVLTSLSWMGIGPATSGPGSRRPTKMTKFICTDGNADVVIDAESALAAAQEYVDSGEWGEITRTDWIDVYVQQDASEIEDRLAALIGEHDYDPLLRRNTGWVVYEAVDLDIDAIRTALPECEIALDSDGDLIVEHGYERERYTIEIEPTEPECDGDNHDWRSPYSVLGGIKENPGVWGHGGGVVIREVCAHCGRYKIVDTWAQRGDTGEQGLESVEYEEADDASLAWVAHNRYEVLAAEVEEIATRLGYDLHLDHDGFGWYVYGAEESAGDDLDDAEIDALNAALLADLVAKYTGDYSGSTPRIRIVLNGPS